ncbi:alpha-1,2-fucosyltransferase [Sphingobacterium sp. FBM7-1]|uniref:alpha-1,2-fucosyltransferase n=1 Tax=Sphingobacterium sp. FBM7-1 TaxID=2886688 RepID=UPI001D1293A8|nr:alpha-1,2-fucosyltransferase [Sphingobacterium sp. FBM7-1]MCC2599739.1 alpha-1,2-fucosyltransferase [Sphingobacterium sp. FBM7-1]
MIVTKLQGGLGNQMFQFAAAYATSTDVYLDLDFLNHHSESNETFTPRPYELSIFSNIRFKEAGIYRKKLFTSSNIFYRSVRKFIRSAVVKQQGNEMINFEPNRHLYLDGYFQSERYFVHARNAILRTFHFPPLDDKNQGLAASIANAKNSVSLHIRRGDYLKPEVAKYHGVLPLSYYSQAIELIQNKLDDIELYIFSDDPVFAQENFGHLCHVTLVNGNEREAWKDMALMSMCQHHIIANSSFSWWGAWLAQQNGIHIAPRDWFNPKVVTFDINNIIPKNWVII